MESARDAPKPAHNPREQQHALINELHHRLAVVHEQRADLAAYRDDTREMLDAGIAAYDDIIAKLEAAVNTGVQAEPLPSGSVDHQADPPPQR